MTDLKAEIDIGHRAENLFASSLHKDELRPGVRSYAENLRSQIRQEFENRGITSLDQLENMSRNAQISIEDMTKIQKLMDRLSVVTKTGELSKDEQEILEQQLREELKPVTEDFINREEIFAIATHSGQITPQRAHTIRGLLNMEPLSEEEKMDELLIFAEMNCKIAENYEVLLDNKQFLQNLLESIRQTLPEDKKPYSALLASMVFNKILSGLPEEEAKKVVQELSLNYEKQFEYLGYGLNGATLIIHGKGGHNLGFGMKKGKIEAEEAGDRAGSNMAGGELTFKQNSIITEEEVRRRKMMTIAMVFIRLGQLRFGNVGFNMKGGKITVLETGSSAGESMTGGEINVGIVRGVVGENMKNGTIRIEEYYSDLGKERKGGKIYFKGKRIGKKWGII